MAPSSVKSEDSISGPSQGFEPREDDADTLWEVIEITGEKGDRYKVRWEGVDPATLKPWAQSWVPKTDCTDDLVIEWKKKKKRKSKSSSSKGNRDSTASRKTIRSSIATTSIAPSSKSSTSLKSTSTIPAQSGSNTRRRRLSALLASPRHDSVKREPSILDDDKTANEREATPQPPLLRTKTNGKTKKRKLGEADSAHNSANIPSSKAIDDDGDTRKKRGEEAPPKKKRRILMEIVQPAPDDKHAPPTNSFVEDQEEVVPEIEDQNEDEFRMVDDVAPEVLDRSPLADDHPELANSPQLEAESERDELDEESDTGARRKPIGRPVKNKRTSKSKLDKNSSTKVGTSKMTPPRKQDKLHDNPLEFPMTRSKPKPTTKKKQPPVKKSKTAPVADSIISLTSDSDEGRPPQLYFSSPNKHRPPIQEPSVVYDGGDAFPVRIPQRHEPKLSPAALERLKQFDREVMQEEEEEETQRVEITPAKHDGAEKVEGSVKSNDKGKERAKESSAVPSRSLSPVSRDNTIFKPSATSALHPRPPPAAIAAKPKNDRVEPSTATAATDTLNTRKRTKASSRSYITDVIPETEVEESQSQSQDMDLRATPAVELPVYASLHPPSTPGGRNTIKSRMKPRTPSRAPSIPGSETEGKAKQKILRPLQRLSPSVFHALLPILEPDSSLPESIEQEDSSFKQSNSKRPHVDANELEAPMSSIEEFESPEKETTVQQKVVIADNEVQRPRRETASDIWESEIMQRGQQLAEAAKKRNKSPPKPKKTLEEIHTSRSRSQSNVVYSDIIQGAVSHNGPETAVDDDEDMIDTSTVVVPPASGPRTLDITEEGTMTVQAMEEAYVDLDGGLNAQSDNPILRQEEESNQDSIADLQALQNQRGMDLESGLNVKSSSPFKDDQSIKPSKGKERAQKPVESRLLEDPQPEIVLQPVSNPTSPVPYQSSESNQPLPVRSRSGSKASTGGAQQPHGEPQSANATIAIPPRQTSFIPVPPDQSINGLQANLDSVKHTLESKLEEIVRLEGQLASERAKNQLLQEEVQRLQPQIVYPTQLEAGTRDEVMQRPADNEVISSEKASWEAERSDLLARLNSAEKAQVDAVKDRDFFREQYAQASGYVTSIRDENKDLEKRVKIAEGQASSGVALVRATFETRISALEKDVESWRMMAKFLIEKDKRSDNDNLRRRAAEQPELKRSYEAREKQLQEALDDIDNLSEELVQRNNTCAAAEVEIQEWKSEITRLNIELNEAKAKLEKIGKAYNRDESIGSDMDGNGHEFVYCCQWRSHNGDESVSCREVFSTISALEEHLFSDRHLQRI